VTSILTLYRPRATGSRHRRSQNGFYTHASPITPSVEEFISPCIWSRQVQRSLYISIFEYWGEKNWNWIDIEFFIKYLIKSKGKNSTVTSVMWRLHFFVSEDATLILDCWHMAERFGTVSYHVISRYFVQYRIVSIVSPHGHIVPSLHITNIMQTIFSQLVPYTSALHYLIKNGKFVYIVFYYFCQWLFSAYNFTNVWLFRHLIASLYSVFHHYIIIMICWNVESKMPPHAKCCLGDWGRYKMCHSKCQHVWPICLSPRRSVSQTSWGMLPKHPTHISQMPVTQIVCCTNVCRPNGL